MLSKLNKPTGEYGRWLLGLTLSVLLLGVFLYFQKNDPKVLELDIKWLVVAIIPLVAAFLTSNAIQKFKGFGLELETKLQDPIGQINLQALDALQELAVGEKRSTAYLDSLSLEEKSQIRRLTFVEGENRRYDPQGVRDYFDQLPNLQFIEIRNGEGRFIALIPLSIFKNRDYSDEQRIHEFILSLRQRNTPIVLGANAITETVSCKDNLIDVVLKVRESPYGLLPVISSKGQFLGIITKDTVETKIADAVIAARKKTL